MIQHTISVIICTHNPRNQYLTRVLQSLKTQTLSKESWELLLIDNASDKVLLSEIDLSWHPQSRYLREDELGLTPARLRGIKESQGETIVFVDDDNVLEPDYLEVVLRISKNYPVIGAWGGQTIPEFEVEPPIWTKPYWGYLAVLEFQEDKWSNLLHQNETSPCGAGMCVRKNVANKYADLIKYDSARLKLGRKGLDEKSQILLSGEDKDLAFTACDIGLGTGIFTALRLKHLIPANRVTTEYFVRLIEGTSYSTKILESLRGKMPDISEPFWKRKLSEFYKLQKMHPQERPFFKAQLRGEELARKQVSSWK
ncbi:MAG: glycosyltransferase family 2 protein [Richelia sp. RM2_1_2]|nr:glycosyltransferase family 2 protein [Richelia sp. RM1_1_1]NJO58652.1 glycosyltransferase family 2 protein [Richelia sp. RM2_1_2]